MKEDIAVQNKTQYIQVGLFLYFQTKSQAGDRVIIATPPPYPQSMTLRHFFQKIQNNDHLITLLIFGQKLEKKTNLYILCLILDSNLFLHINFTQIWGGSAFLIKNKQ